MCEHKSVTGSGPKNTDLRQLADLFTTLMDDWDGAMGLICLSGAIGRFDDTSLARIGQKLAAECGARAVDSPLSPDQLKILSAIAPFKATSGAVMKDLKCIRDYPRPPVRQCDDYVPQTMRIVGQLTRRILGPKHTV
jgi:hypothetical protein